MKNILILTTSVVSAVDCAVGYYLASDSATTCTACASGTWRAADPVASVASFCIACAAGYQGVTVTGKHATCTICPAGTESPAETAADSVCTLCNDKEFSHAGGECSTTCMCESSSHR